MSKQLMSLDYVYYNDNENIKKIGEIEDIEIENLISFIIKIRGETLWCRIGKGAYAWYIEIIDRGIMAELATLDDEFWNSESIIRATKDYDTGIAIAKAIKVIYEKYGDEFT